MHALLENLAYPVRILVIIALIIGIHLIVILVRALGSRLMLVLPRGTYAKGRSLAGLLTSVAIFVLYFVAVGLVLKEFGVSLAAYLASASVLGLAIGFGSQGLVQDIASIITAAYEQFPGIFITRPSSEGRIKTHSGKEFLRVKFRIWPGRSTILETTFKQEIVQSLKEIEPDFADWMVAVNYEVEKKTTTPVPKKTKTG